MDVGGMDCSIGAGQASDKAPPMHSCPGLGLYHFPGPPPVSTWPPASWSPPGPSPLCSQGSPHPHFRAAQSNRPTTHQSAQHQPDAPFQVPPRLSRAGLMNSNFPPFPPPNPKTDHTAQHVSRLDPCPTSSPGPRRALRDCRLSPCLPCSHLLCRSQGVCSLVAQVGRVATQSPPPHKPSGVYRKASWRRRCWRPLPPDPHLAYPAPSPLCQASP